MNTVDFSDSERQLAGLQESMGVSTEILTAEDIKSIAPFLNVEDIGIGRFCKEDGIVDAHALLQVYIKKARALGATVEEGVDVINIVTEHDKIVGIETTQGFISTPILINAAGIYADQVGRWAGIDIPINKRLGHIIFTEPIPSVPEDMPLLEIMNPELIYIGSSRKRVDYTVGDLDTDSFEHKPNLDLILEKHFDDLFYRASDIARAGIVNCTAGVRAATPDGIPILGPVEQVSGFINNCGLGGNGIIYSPCVGKLVAQYITGTNKMPLSIEPFLLKRFYSQ